MGNGCEQRLELVWYEGDVLVGTEVYEDRGETWYDVVPGNPVLHSSMRQGLQIDTEVVLDDGYFTGELDVLQDVAGGGQRVTLRTKARLLARGAGLLLFLIALPDAGSSPGS